MLEVEFLNENAIQALAVQYKSADRVSFQAMEFPPPITEIDVKLKWKSRKMTFRAAIQSWRPGAAALKPMIDPFEFEGQLERLRATREVILPLARPAATSRPAAPRSEPPRPEAAKPQPPPKPEPDPQAAAQTPEPAPQAPAPTPQPTIEDKAFVFLNYLRLDPAPVMESTDTGDNSILWLEGTPTDGGEACLQAESPKGAKWFVFARNGMPIRAYQLPASRRTTLVRLLQQQKQLTEEQVQQTLTLAEEGRIPEETALARLGILPPEFIEKATQAKLRLLLAKLANEPTVNFSIHYSQDLVADGVPEETAAAPAPPPVYMSGQVGVLKEALDKYRDLSWDDATHIQDRYLSDCPMLTGDPKEIAESLKLGDKGTRFLANCLNGETALRNVYKTTNLSRKNTFALVFGLLDIGLIEFQERPAEELLTEELVRVIGERFNALEKASLFNRLDLHWSATGEEIAASSERFLQEFSTATASRVGIEVAKKAEAVMDGIREAASLLSTSKGRMTHRLTFLEPFNISQAIDLMNAQLDMEIYRVNHKMINQLLARIAELNPSIGQSKRAETVMKLRNQAGGE